MKLIKEEYENCYLSIELDKILVNEIVLKGVKVISAIEVIYGIANNINDFSR